MSLARQDFQGRIAAIKSAIVDFRLQDLPPIPANVSYNNSVRMIRNGLAVQCFNVFEDFIKARTGELLAMVSSSGVAFRYLPEDFQWAASVDAVRAIDFQMKLRDKSGRIQYAQDYSEKIASTKAPVFNLPDVSFFQATSNIAKDHFRDALAAFSISKPWPQVSGLCSRIGLSGLPADNVFHTLAQRRHKAAHSPSASVSEVDLTQSLIDAIGLAVSFDVLATKSAKLMSVLAVPHPSNASLIVSHSSIPLRFIKYSARKYFEIKEGATRKVRVNVDSSLLIPDAIVRSEREKGALIIFDEHGSVKDWAA